MAETVRSLHDKAMDLAQEAVIAHREAHNVDVRRLFAEAYTFERQAADMIPAEPGRELSRGILYRSAAWLAHNAGLYQEAFDMAQAGHSGNEPAWLAVELAEVGNAAWEALHKDD